MYINFLLEKTFQQKVRIHLYLKLKKITPQWVSILISFEGSRKSILPDRGDKPCVRVVPLWCKNEPHFGIEDWEVEWIHQQLKLPHNLTSPTWWNLKNKERILSIKPHMLGSFYINIISNATSFCLIDMIIICFMNKG